MILWDKQIGGFWGGGGQLTPPKNFLRLSVGALISYALLVATGGQTFSKESWRLWGRGGALTHGSRGRWRPHEATQAHEQPREKEIKYSRDAATCLANRSGRKNRIGSTEQLDAEQQTPGSHHFLIVSHPDLLRPPPQEGDRSWRYTHYGKLCTLISYKA